MESSSGFIMWSSCSNVITSHGQLFAFSSVLSPLLAVLCIRLSPPLQVGEVQSHSHKTSESEAVAGITKMYIIST